MSVNAGVTRSEMLDEMGLSPQWRLRETRTVRRGEAKITRLMDANVSLTTEAPVLAVEKSRAIERLRDVQTAQKSEETQQCAPEAFAGLSPAEDIERSQEISTPNWGALAVDSCRACARCHERKNALVGVGDHAASWLFVGESPDEIEDERGEGFVGPAGELLDAMLSSIDVKRGENVYLTHALKCGSVNRAPETKDINACMPYLRRQIALIEPSLIVLFGELVAQTLLQESGSLESLRGRVFTIHEGGREISVLVTYPPAYLLRNLPDKAKAWEDLCLARSVMVSLQSGVGALHGAAVKNN